MFLEVNCVEEGYVLVNINDIATIKQSGDISLTSGHVLHTEHTYDYLRGKLRYACKDSTIEFMARTFSASPPKDSPPHEILEVPDYPSPSHGGIYDGSPF